MYISSTLTEVSGRLVYFKYQLFKILTLIAKLEVHFPEEDYRFCFKIIALN